MKKLLKGKAPHIYFVDSGDDLAAVSMCSSSKQQVWVGLIEGKRRVLLDRKGAKFLAGILSHFAKTGRLPSREASS